ncbi:response regulator transcription factor [Advenella mimigardefordensis]|uniref:Two component transcriptional regulator, CheY-like superfamily n=1 Tax=Advenella mimigardefordensis (strain DSM 17166 / LMG 22922 / DPN7) TaxID=1247726 RepID=W0PDH5_ADVMD|nr:response regulator transcription factor [Advenella mimigardefordensis]AHG64924.1 two component transcriptional regulator, CheY-like superfamily [Advenella mimigardefordensis DPN7]
MSTHKRVLLVEDDISIAANICSYLEKKNYMVDVAYEGNAAISLLGQYVFDAVVLDLGLPGKNGFDVLQYIRNQAMLSTPVVILTARDDLQDKLTGFSLGTDDYLTKPFSLSELEARVNALIKRATGNVANPVRRWGQIEIDTRSHIVSIKGLPIHLTRKSYDILSTFVQHPGEVITKERFESLLWADDPKSSDALRSQIHLLRKALAEHDCDVIETVHGTGWRLGKAEEPT